VGAKRTGAEKMRVCDEENRGSSSIWRIFTV
jgi:hypothetical protein